MSARNPANAGSQHSHKYKDRAFASSNDQENFSWREEEERDRSGLYRTAAHDGRYKEGARKHPRRQEDDDAALSQHNPVAPALMHGNQPSQGAKVDEELMHDDELRMKEKEGYGHDQE
ncbi:hypothetical protein KEM54_005943 [Ascosphaera aggregata]|nr:hypothetical protein KEM54_005943 [Ascosphaera aggregata]